MRPRIGITAPRRGMRAPYYLIKFSVWLCGGRPVPLTRLETVGTKSVDGLVLGGGTDVFPALYKTTPKDAYRYDHDRDAVELAWLTEAEKCHIPVLGICRGAQMMNVMNEGTLHLDVSQAYEDADYPKSLWRKAVFRKGIAIEADSLLARLVGTLRLRVNSMHSQSIDRPGRALTVTAREANGVVQAIERPGHPFYLGVQFHPEFMIYRPSMRAVFRGLVGTASQRQTA